MANSKKSFVLYTDYRRQIERLNDADAGALFKALIRYGNDESSYTMPLQICS